jgi:hypothetical protein
MPATLRRSSADRLFPRDCEFFRSRSRPISKLCLDSACFALSRAGSLVAVAEPGLWLHGMSGPVAQGVNEAEGVMSVTRVVVIACLAGALAAAPSMAVAQETTFIALGSDPDEVVGHGSDTYFDAATADFTVNRTSGVHRHFITIIIQPKDGSAWWSLGFTTPEFPASLEGTFYATESPGFASAAIGVNAAGTSCGRRVGSFTVRELRLALPAHVGFAVAIDFDARCEGAAGGLYGQIRIYSALTGSRVGALGMSALSPVAPGTPLRFAVETDSNVPLEFKFIRYQVSTGAWTVIQDYSFRPVWSWTPTLGDLGDYYLQIWARARGSTNGYDSWQGFGPFTVSQSPASIVSLTSDALAPVAPGTSIRWTAAARGGTLRLQYQFSRYSHARGRWEIVRDWSPDAVWMQTTTPVDEGENTVIVAVRSWGGDNLEAIQVAHAVIDPPADSYVLLTRPPAPDLPGGEQILFDEHTGGYMEAGVSNGLNITASRRLPDSYVSAAMRSAEGLVPVVGLYEHAEWRTPDRAAAIPALEVHTTWDLCTAPLTGRFRILELEYDGGGDVSRVAADIEKSCSDEGAPIFVAVRLNSTLPLFNMFPIASNGPSTVGPGTSVTWTADASSGTGPVEYRFIRYSIQDNAWTIAREWSTDRRFTWTPSTSDYGSYWLQVWARTVGSAAAYDDWRSSDLFVVAPGELTVYGLHWDAARARAGQKVSFEAIAGGGSGALEYRFVQFQHATGRWSVIREYAASNRVEWTPPPGSGGEYSIQVWVREIGSMMAYDAWAGAPLTLGPPRLLVISGRDSDPVSLGRSLSVPLSDATSYSSRMIVGAVDDAGVWYGEFDIRRGPWATGVFEEAIGAMSMAPTLYVRHSSTSCTSDTGRFTVNDVAIDPDGVLTTLSIDFEQQCDGAAVPLYGGLRYNSNVPLVYAMSVTPSTTVTAAGSPVTFTGIGSSAIDAVEYRFAILHHETGQWTLVRDYAAQNTINWTPPSPGTYVTQLWVRRRGSRASYESYVNGPPLTVR